MLLIVVTALGSSDIGLLVDTGSAGGVVHQAACTPGFRKVGGVTFKVFCGPARASLRFQGKAYSFRNGSCTKTSRSLTINVGVETLPHPPSTEPPRTSWFGAFVAAGRDGTYHPGSSMFLFWSAPGLSFIFTAGDLHLTANRSKGTFSGLFYGRGITGSAFGAFSC
jgi:hypothetical protein